MKHAHLIVAALALAACNPTTREPDRAPLEVPGNAFLCETFANATRGSLAETYGAVVDQTLPGPEGESYTATVIHPNEPTRRVEIVWGARGPEMVSVRGDASNWTAAGNVQLRTLLTEVETANGRPFTLTGFAWDYAGTTLDWQGGALGQMPCRLMLRFDAGAGDASTITGDGSFASDLPAMRALNPRVREMVLIYTQ